jgi:hypothetical protein
MAAATTLATAWVIFLVLLMVRYGARGPDAGAHHDQLVAFLKPRRCQPLSIPAALEARLR